MFNSNWQISILLLHDLIDLFTFYVSDCGAQADIVFLLDSSGSVGSSNFHKMLTFVQNVAKTFTIGQHDVQIGVDTFQSTHKAEFHMNTYLNKTQLVDAIGKISYHSGGTNTGEAIKFMHNDSFSTAAGSCQW